MSGLDSSQPMTEDAVMKAGGDDPAGHTTPKPDAADEAKKHSAEADSKD